MHYRRRMASGSRIDRTKHEVDITEQVSRGLRTEDSNERGARVVDLGIRPWLAGHVLSAVQVQVLSLSDERDD
jgi:hypothetical protein